MGPQLMPPAGRPSEAGITLIETMIALLVLTIGALGMAGTFLHGMQTATSSPNELVATQKAAEAVESVFSARDAHTLEWNDLQNEANDGIFLDAAQDLKLAGADGIVNTEDDTEIEFAMLPGPDQTLGTGDDVKVSLHGFKRQIVITEISEVLRSLTVIISYPANGSTRTYRITTYISRFA